MINRPCFYVKEENNKISFEEVNIRFEYVNGKSSEDKKKSIINFHNAIKQVIADSRPLEVSTKSNLEIGRKLSAFNLKLKLEDNSYSIENIYQSSKVFEKGGPYIDLLSKSPYEVKKDIRLYSSGKIVHFNLNNSIFSNVPRTFFYDYIFIKALSEMTNLEKLLNFNIFTDIEYNPRKSSSCQARTVAMFIVLSKQNNINRFLSDRSFALQIYKDNYINFEQLSLLEL